MNKYNYEFVFRKLITWLKSYIKIHRIIFVDGKGITRCQFTTPHPINMSQYDRCCALDILGSIGGVRIHHLPIISLLLNIDYYIT